MLPWSQIIAENVWWICAAHLHAHPPAAHPPGAARSGEAQRAAGERLHPAAHRRSRVRRLPFAYILFKVPTFANYPWYPPFVVIGTLVFLCAIWMIYRAHKDLGRSFSYTLEIRHEHELVDNGIYRYIRHPMYAAFLLWTVAQAMLLPNWVVGLCRAARSRHPARHPHSARGEDDDRQLR